MKKLILILTLMVLLLGVGQAFAVDNTFDGSTNNNWNVADNWSEGHVPLAGENVKLGAFVVAVDTAAVPADYATGGRLGTVTATGAGRLTFDMTAMSYSFGCTVITPGTAGTSGFLSTTGASANTFTLTYTSLTNTANSTYVVLYGSTGPPTFTGAMSITGTSSIGVRLTGATTMTYTGDIELGASNNVRGIQIPTGNTATLIYSGSVTPGAGTGQYGIDNSSATTVSMTINGGTIRGGAGIGSYGISGFNVPVTFGANTKLVHGVGGLAYTGRSPIWSPGAEITEIWPAVGGGTGATFAPVVAAGDLKATVQNGSVTGTRTDCPVTSALSTQSYGAGGTELTGTFVSPGATSNVKKGVSYGVGLTGTYAGGLVSDGLAP